MASELERIYAIFRHSQSTLHCSFKRYFIILMDFIMQYKRIFFLITFHLKLMQCKFNRPTFECCFRYKGSILTSDSKASVASQNPLKVLRAFCKLFPEGWNNSILHLQPTPHVHSEYFYH